MRLEEINSSTPQPSEEVPDADQELGVYFSFIDSPGLDNSDHLQINESETVMAYINGSQDAEGDRGSGGLPLRILVELSEADEQLTAPGVIKAVVDFTRDAPLIESPEVDDPSRSTLSLLHSSSGNTAL